MATRRSPRVYAELLPNISQVTVYLTLPDPNMLGATATNSQGHGTFEILNSRQDFSFSYLGKRRSLRLPARVSSEVPNTWSSTPGSGVFSTSHSLEREYSFRLQVDEADRLGPPRVSSGSHIPWSAKDMSPDVGMRCRACENIFLDPQIPSRIEWKDLPSENWAELMDMWHCHKPDAPKDEDRQHSHGADDGNAAAKGYGAGSHPICRADTILLDIMNFYMTQADCIGLELVSPPLHDSGTEDSEKSLQSLTQSSVRCARCGKIVGRMQPALNGLALFKPDISVSQQLGELSRSNNYPVAWKTFPVDLYISAQLLEQIERTGARRYVLHRDDDTTSGILIWIFNPDLRYSCFQTDEFTNEANFDGGQPFETTISAQRAMKLFYQHVSDIQKLLNPDIGIPSSASLEEFPLPAHIYEEIRDLLHKRNSLLPEPAKKFREWDVGLFHLYEET